MTKDEKDKLAYEKFKKERDAIYQEMEKQRILEKENFEKKQELKRKDDTEYRIKKDKEAKIWQKKIYEKEKENFKGLDIYIGIFLFIILVAMPILTGFIFWGKMIIGGSLLGIIGLLIFFSRETGPGAGGLFGFVVIPFVISLVIGGIYLLIGTLLGY